MFVRCIRHFQSEGSNPFLGPDPFQTCASLRTFQCRIAWTPIKLVSEIFIGPQNRFFDSLWGVLTHIVGSLPGLQNEKAESDHSDAPKSRTSMGLLNQIPSEYPTGFFKGREIFESRRGAATGQHQCSNPSLGPDPLQTCASRIYFSMESPGPPSCHYLVFIGNFYFSLMPLLA